ncbi:MAG: glycosyltransferase involved in cell wall biosynthesis [Yoonia sp.]|jgi:glycosyltransferase involved in cell wall biosynthesis
MRITFILPYASLAGGVRVVASYAKELTAMGHDVSVISKPKKRPRRLKRWTSWLRGKDTQPHGKVPTSLLSFLGDRHIVLDRFRDVIAADVPDADVIFATWWDTAFAVNALPSEKGQKFYLLQDYETFDYLPVDQVVRTYRLPLHKIAVSNYIKDKITKNHNISDVTVVPNAVDTTVFDSPPRSKNDAFTVGFLCNSNPRKRVELAIEAVRRAKALYPELRVCAFGAKPPEARLEMPEWVDFHLAPDQKDIPALYRACDLWLFTSEAEGFGLPLVEAMGCGTPVLATRTGAAGDLIHGDNGEILAADGTLFAQRIDYFARMPDAQWQAFSHAAYTTVHDYSWKNAADTLLHTIAQTPARQDEPVS